MLFCSTQIKIYLGVLVNEHVGGSCCFLAELLLKTVRENIRKEIPTIVFCNKTATVHYLAGLLRDRGVRPVSVLFSDKRGQMVGYSDLTTLVQSTRH